MGVSQNLKQGGFAGLRQTDDSNAEHAALFAK
jgi:hypothetical protein